MLRDCPARLVLFCVVVWCCALYWWILVGSPGTRVLPFGFLHEVPALKAISIITIQVNLK